MLRLGHSIIGCITALATVTHAADHRIAVIQVDAELRRAISLAFSPWGVETIPSDEPPPASSPPEAVVRAAELARQLGADAVVWVSTSGQGSLLWVYDARTEGLTMRALVEEPPFESAEAAAVALSVKTVLRASVMAPAPQPFVATTTQSVPKADRFAWETGADVHFFATAKAEPRLALSGTVWMTSSRRLGAGLTISAGPGVGVDAESYLGRYRDMTFGSSLRWRVLPGEMTTACLLVGATVHASTFEGALVQSSTKINVQRLNTSLDAGGTFDFKLARGAYLGVSAHASYLTSYQRYLVDGQPVFALWPVALTLGGHLGVDLF